MKPNSAVPGLLHGRTALVTGCARGLGRAIATRFSNAGAAVVAVDLAQALDKAALPESWERVAVDLSADDAESALRSLAARLPRLDVLVANAGIVPPWRRIAALERVEWDETFAVNVRGVGISLKAFADLLAGSEHGSAILMSSLNGWRGHADQAAYTASKHAVVGLTRAAALDLGRCGVRVNALAPGPVATEALVERIRKRSIAGGPRTEDALAAYAAGSALGILATPRMIADAALFLASDLSAGVTGTVLPVDCGQ